VRNARRLQETAIRRLNDSAQYLLIMLFVAVCFSSSLIAGLWWFSRYSDLVPVPSVMASRQASDPEIVAWDGNANFWGELKLHRIWLEKPEVIMVGSSRGGQLRSKMFRPYKFYNASFTAWNLDQTADFIARVTSAFTPRVVIIALDYFMFTNVYADGVQRQREMYYDRDLKFEAIAWRNLVTRLSQSHDLTRVFYNRPITQRQFIGFDAMRLSAGYRWDGSFRYPVRGNVDDRKIPYNHLAFIAAFPGGAAAEERQLAALERLHNLAESKGFTLVGIQLPILKPAVDFLDSDKAFWPYSGVWRDFESDAMKSRFQKLDVHFFNLARNSVTTDTINFYDSYHPNEVGMLRSLIDLCGDPEFRAIFPKLSVAGLRSDLARPLTEEEPPSIYGSEF
jgi:hypothetical protein